MSKTRVWRVVNVNEFDMSGPKLNTQWSMNDKQFREQITVEGHRSRILVDTKSFVVRELKLSSRALLQIFYVEE